VLQKPANALDTTTDFLMQGSADEWISAQLTDKELFNRIKPEEK